jgi:O-6-methylguanine DNA methyltransferase
MVICGNIGLLRHRLEQCGHHALPIADKKRGCGRTNSAGRVPGAEQGAPTLEVVEAVAAVKCYFEGEETDFSGFKLDLDEQDPFFKRIYAAARRVGWGHTTTYGTLAKELGAGPEAARDVGQAVARNPVALIIPCHRAFREISLAPDWQNIARNSDRKIIRARTAQWDPHRPVWRRSP